MYFLMSNTMRLRGKTQKNRIVYGAKGDLNRKSNAGPYTTRVFMKEQTEEQAILEIAYNIIQALTNVNKRNNRCPVCGLPNNEHKFGCAQFAGRLWLTEYDKHTERENNR